ncbi:MAG: molybdopterin-binding protein [Pyrobaculum sp.]
MYAVARLYGYVEELGFKAWLSTDVAKALGIRPGDGVRLESKAGASAARVVDYRDDVKAAVLLTLDAYMAVSGLRTVLLKKLPRVFEAEAVALGVEASKSLDVDTLTGMINILVAYRVPVFTGFAGFVQAEDGTWTKLLVKGVSPREPAYLTRETRIYVR